MRWHQRWGNLVTVVDLAGVAWFILTTNPRVMLVLMLYFLARSIVDTIWANREAVRVP